MAQQEYIPVLDDGLILQASPLVILDTAYYELWLQQSGASDWEQHTFLSPLPMYTLGSPGTSQPCIVLSPLPDTTTYYYMVRRFNSDGVPSRWVTGSFTTG